MFVDELASYTVVRKILCATQCSHAPRKIKKKSIMIVWQGIDPKDTSGSKYLKRSASDGCWSHVIDRHLVERKETEVVWHLDNLSYKGKSDQDFLHPQWSRKAGNWADVELNSLCRHLCLQYAKVFFIWNTRWMFWSLNLAASSRVRFSGVVIVWCKLFFWILLCIEEHRSHRFISKKEKLWKRSCIHWRMCNASGAILVPSIINVLNQEIVRTGKYLIRVLQYST